MNEPIERRLRTYYQSIQRDVPVRLEARIAKSMNEVPAGRQLVGSTPKLALAFGTIVAVAVIAGLAMNAVAPGPGVASPSTSKSPPTYGPTNPTPTNPASPSIPIISPSTTPSPASSPAISDLIPTSPHLDSAASVRLLDGEVLIVGGRTAIDGAIPSRSSAAFVFDPGANRFTPTGSMAQPRIYFTATLLHDGRVLVAGGADLMDGIDNLATAELYDPATGRFTPTGSMAHGRAKHTATLLADGRVLIAGGYGGGTSPLASAEIYDPRTGRFSKTGSMAVARLGHAAAALPDGRVLVTGGQTENPAGPVASAELYDPATARFSTTGSLLNPRSDHAAATLVTGKVLVAGGTPGDGGTLYAAELYDPTTGRFRVTGSMSIWGNAPASSALLPDMRVVVAEGLGINIYDPASGTFRQEPAADATVYGLTALSDGRVLVLEVGGALLLTP